MERLPAALVTYASTLVHLHLGQAVDSCILGRKVATQGKRGERPLERRYALGSIIHGYAALEGVANKLKFEVFDNREGRLYAPRDPRDLATAKYLSDWQRVPLEDKLVFLSEKARRPFVKPWIAEVREMRQFRHLLVHGITIKSVILFEDTTDDSQEATQQDWYYDRKFPVMRFPRPDLVTSADALRS